MITIGKPEVIFLEDKARLQAKLDFDGQLKLVWFEVDKKYAEYLCYERSDAYVIGVLNYAMRNGHDITCKSPIGEDLYYQITTYLIDAVFKGSKKLYKTKIIAEVDNSKLKSANAVGTGISCGIDSFHAISTHTNSKYKNHNVTHLAFNNVGSHGEGEKAIILYEARKKLAIKFANEYQYELVESNSNIYDEIPQSHFMTHTYTSTFAIYALQKLFSTYYYASGRKFLDFSLIDTYNKDCSYYDLLLSSVFSTSWLKLYSEGATLSRLEKTKKVSQYKPSYNYLNVCTQTITNCNKCDKCIRTLLALEAIGKLEDYKTVFDIEYYKNNKQEYYKELVYQTLRKNVNYVEIYPLLKSQIGFSAKINGIVKSIIIVFIPARLKLLLKKMYHLLIKR
ncbi:MAG TPA: hypothetical protein VFC65_03450 [Prolixibacteraceae bacterium]|nr:hypothetical protein [Prolixibacteraceae bacterium]